jgi:hypothetical protein
MLFKCWRDLVWLLSWTIISGKYGPLLYEVISWRPCRFGEVPSWVYLIWPWLSVQTSINEQIKNSKAILDSRLLCSMKFALIRGRADLLSLSHYAQYEWFCNILDSLKKYQWNFHRAMTKPAHIGCICMLNVFIVVSKFNNNMWIRTPLPCRPRKKVCDSYIVILFTYWMMVRRGTRIQKWLSFF